MAACAEVSSAAGVEPAGFQPGLVSSTDILGQSDCGHGAKPANHRPAAAAIPDFARHVSGGNNCIDLFRSGSHRNAVIGYPAGLA